MKRKTNLVVLTVLALFTFLFSSCSDEMETAGIDSLRPEQIKGTIYPSALLVNDQPMTKSAAKNDKVWPQFSTINIKFTSGSSASAIAKVKEYAKEWEQHINLTFNFDNASAADVIINIKEVAANDNSMGEDRLNWSFLGTDSKVRANMGAYATMNLTLKTGTEASAEFKGSVLMQFGNMLGLIYEYMRGDLTYNGQSLTLIDALLYPIILGNSGAVGGSFVYVYSPNNSYGLITEDAEGNPLNWGFDPQSIMLPYFPGINYITYANGSPVIASQNTVLSSQDVEYISAIYPKMEAKYERGKAGSVHISIRANNWPWDYAIAPWNYDLDQVSSNGRIEGTYPTIGVGEYEWTAQNLKMKFASGEDRWWANYTISFVNNYMGDKFVANATDAQKIRAFEELHGTWVIPIAGATSFAERAQVNFTRKDSEFAGELNNFLLPDRTAILQMIGQMPKANRGDFQDLHNFIVGYPEWNIENIDMSKLGGHEKTYKNISGMNVTFLGERDGAQGLPNSIGWGVEFRWYTKEWDDFSTNAVLFSKFGSGFTSNWGMHFNGYTSKFASVRYCRAMTVEELGYELHENTEDDIVEIVRYGENPSYMATQTPIAKGLLRGVVLSNIYKGNKDDVSTWKVLKPLSELKADAAYLQTKVGDY